MEAITDQGTHSDCIGLDERTLLVAAGDGRSWLVTLANGATVALPRSSVARRRASLAAGAIEGAIYAGLTHAGSAPAQPASDACAFDDSPRHVLLRYVKWLAGNALFAAQTPGLFREGAARLAAQGRSDLAAFAQRKADEEDGHAALALADLTALGLQADVVVRALNPPSATAFALRFRDLVHSADPIALFGFSYCMERMALERDAAFAASVAAALPPGCKAQRFLAVHSALGSDQAHVDEQLALFESCTAAARHAIVKTAFQTACMLAAQREMDRALTAQEIEGRLTGFGGNIACMRGPGADSERGNATSRTDAYCHGDAVASYQSGPFSPQPGDHHGAF